MCVCVCVCGGGGGVLSLLASVTSLSVSFPSSVAIRLISLGIYVAAVSAHFPRGVKPSAEVTESTEMLLCRVFAR